MAKKKTTLELTVLLRYNELPADVQSSVIGISVLQIKWDDKPGHLERYLISTYGEEIKTFNIITIL